MGRSTLPLTLALLLVAACASQPGTPYTLDAAPLTFLDDGGPATADQRGRFREILCAVSEASGGQFADQRPCDEILHRFSDEPPGPGEPVRLGPARSKLLIAAVAGLGADCFPELLQPFPLAFAHLRRLGYRTEAIEVGGLSGSASNGRRIRDAVLAMDLAADERLILVGYSKGTPDILEGLAAYPELQERVAAVISIAGAVAGSPLSVDAPDWMLSLVGYLPGSNCADGGGGAVESLKPSVRRSFAANHPLPQGVAFYSLGTFAPPEDISTLLRGSYDELSRIDPRNDGQMLFYDQVIPGGALLGFVRSDHWAVALPFARAHPNLAPGLIDRNGFPREVLLEAAVRHVEERLPVAPGPDDGSTLGGQD